MSKFEQLLDYLVNEEMDKANELFHEIVVEKSREIYENLISEEEEEEVDEAADEEMDEAEEDDEELDEAADEEEMDESADEEMDEAEEEMDEEEEELEDSYMMDGDDDEMPAQDATDNLGADAGMDDMEAPSDPEEKVKMEIQAAIDKLEQAFATLGGDSDMGANSSDMDMGADDETDEMMGIPAMENRRITREYKEKVGNDWDKNSMKAQGQYAGAGTGEKDGSPVEGRSPISSGKGKPTTGATHHNILGKSATAAEDGTKPHGKVGGLVKQGGKFTGSGTHNVDGVESGVKTVKKQGSGYPGNNKSAGPVGSGTGDKAGQTGGAESAKSPINGAPNRNA